MKGQVANTHNCCLNIWNGLNKEGGPCTVQYTTAEMD